jgi:putative transposase
MDKEEPMPAHKNHHNTPEPTTTSVSISPSDVPSEESFHQHLRDLIRGATRIVMEEIMQEELSLFLGAKWGESTSQRRGYRNGSYSRDLIPSTGRIENVSVPRDREGMFHTQAFEGYSRYEPHVAQALTEMFVSGSSTHKIGKVANTQEGVAPSASSVSRLNASLSEQFETWRIRPLQTHYRMVYLDGVHFSIRHGSHCDASIILTILGVDGEGNKEVLALRACAEESREGWLSILQDMRSRGATQVDLFVTDGHEGLLGALSELFTATPRQRCLVHKQRNVLSAVARREREQVQADLLEIWKQERKEDALTNLAAFKAKYGQRYPEAVRSLDEDEEHLLTFYAFPVGMHRHIQTTNAIESFFSNVRQRTD